MSPHIKIQWLGTRKDSGRGSVWAWFTETGKRAEPLLFYERNRDSAIMPYCHVLWGSLGKKLHIQEFELTDEFLTMAKARSNNFKQQPDPTKVISKWGKTFDEELSMYLLMLKMKG
jgi:hypothetical protein